MKATGRRTRRDESREGGDFWKSIIAFLSFGVLFVIVLSVIINTLNQSPPGTTTRLVLGGTACAFLGASFVLSLYVWSFFSPVTLDRDEPEVVIKRITSVVTVCILCSFISGACACMICWYLSLKINSYFVDALSVKP